jgi:CubicO group peptidase (beta-lactamase class C family)
MEGKSFMKPTPLTANHTLRPCRGAFLRDPVVLALSLFLVAPMMESQVRIEQRPGEVSHDSVPFAWPTATAAEAGLDPAKLEAAAELAAAGASDSLLVIHDGRLVVERYWNGKTARDVQQTYSGTKSLYALLIGRAIERGYISGLDQPLRELIPEMPDAQAQITFRGVLGMVSGMENSLQIESLGGSGKTQLEIALEREIIAAPFEKYHYNNGAYRLTFTALERASGRSLETLTAEEVLGPLGIDGAFWMRIYALDENGRERFTGYQSIRMTPRDYAKSAQVILDAGMWNGERFLPQAFTDQLAQSPAPEVNPSFGLFFHLNAGDFHRDYGVPDRLERKLIPGAPDDTFLMYGAGGQLVAGIPSLRLVIVRTGGDSGSSLYEADNFFAGLIRGIAEAAAPPSR